MKQMSKIALILALCVSTQAFGWVIRFDRSIYLDKDNKPTNARFELLTFRKLGDFNKAVRSEFIAQKTNDAFLDVLPLIGEGAGSVTIPDPQTMAILKSIEASSKVFTKAFKEGLVTRPINFLTREYYTIDYISDFKPSMGGNYKCKDAKSLKGDHFLDKHKIKSNQNIVYVIYDKKSQQILFVGEGPAYGFFTFKLVDFVDENGNPYLDENKNLLKIGDLELISKEGGKSCPVKYGEIPIPAVDKK